MNIEMDIVYKTLYVEFDTIIESYAGFDAYFASHPDEEKNFPRIHERKWYKRKFIKSREMFIGKKTQIFTKLLEILSIDIDTAYLEAEYYLTPRGKGKIYRYENDTSSVAFDFHIDPTDQIETCGISLSYPKDKESDIIELIRKLRSTTDIIAVYDGKENSFI